ncbi:MAG: hypothetical protein ABJN39_09520 [Sulfitobacter sp.]|uniref:hypothetical protein n=1 Tax=Alphaproteobacteria TaxID=28211 RepID=UPI002942691A|nr:hypothetical protein [Sulfitobacter sp. LC.270.F.C4]WOI13542.1 hypothetical protein R1T45_01920 [Sulfitobacter sp. LC.270.F.C4]
MMRAALTAQDAGRLAEWVEGLPIPFTLTMREGKVRSLNQNALLHKWFGEIAKQTHSTADQVKRECKFYQGCPILMAEDPQFVAFLSHLKSLTVEQKIAAMDYISVTSVMNTKQLSAMCDAIEAKYLPQGIRLTQPEDKQ